MVERGERLSTPCDLPVFPLTGMLLLPGIFMPLNIFEQRYRNMVEDALEAGRVIGMIQPMQPALDNFGSVDESSRRPELYSIGCAGAIEECELQPDGRYLIVLAGIERFSVVEELSLHRGYRRVRARLLSDRVGDQEVDGSAQEALLAQAIAYCSDHEIVIDPDVLAALPDWRLVNSLAAALPFRPEEKQALLEAPSIADRSAMLLKLLELGRLRPGVRSSHQLLDPN